MPFRPPSLLLVLVLGVPLAPAAGQQADRREPRQIADSVAIAGLARDLVAGARTDSARAAALYEWVATHLSWDVQGYLAHRSSMESPEDVYRRRVALCGGYVALFARLAREAGLTAAPVTGYAKGFDYRHGQGTRHSNHAWVAVRLDGSWRLVDPTWGSGFVEAGRFVPRFTWAYFLVPPDELILSHFPQKASWQLVARPLRRRDFERMPAVPRDLFDVGFAPDAVRTTALTRGVHGFPLIGRSDSQVQVLQAPIAGTLPSNSRVELDLIWPGATDVAVVTGDVWTHLTRSGDRFHGSAAAAVSSVFVVGRVGPDARQYRTLLHYRVE
jgi:hypothetical protein